MENKFQIDGFHCEACVKLATMKIKKMSDVENVEVAEDGLAKIFAGREIAVDEVAKALDGLGYEVKAA